MRRERAIRPLAIGRKNWLFAGSDAGGERAATVYTLVETAKLTALIRKATCAPSSRASPITR
jgi:transposase IS66 family protein